MPYYIATVTTDASGDGNNLDSGGNPVWNAQFRGYLVGVRYAFSGSAASGADTTLDEPHGLQRTIDSLTDTNTDATRHVAAAIEGSTESYMGYYVDSTNLRVVVAQGGASVTDAVTVYVLIDEV